MLKNTDVWCKNTSLGAKKDYFARLEVSNLNYG